MVPHFGQAVGWGLYSASSTSKLPSCVRAMTVQPSKSRMSVIPGLSCGRAQAFAGTQSLGGVPTKPGSRQVHDEPVYWHALPV